ncbi:DUF3445 domain-containing protein, partial [Candidatus Saccharibacteria bacterium]|nr:DUF3445 domain-containing protein [Candidatus Saccharibacteria bacterium]
MNYEAVSAGCPVSRVATGDDQTVFSTNWDYLRGMKMNALAPSPNMALVTDPERRSDNFTPWFWPDNELAAAIDIRRKAYVNHKERVLNTADNDPMIRAACQRLLGLQARYLAEYFPEKYSIENSKKYGKVIINTANEGRHDAYQLYPGEDGMHPLAISGMLGQEDVCIVRSKKNGRQVLVAGFLASPTNWNLSDFMNQDMDEIHRNVEGYHEPARSGSRYMMKNTVDKFLLQLRQYPQGITWRNNQFIEYIPTLAREPQDDTDYDHDAVYQDPGENIYLRTERETLARLPEPYEDFVIFTIKPHVFRMSDVRRLRGDDFIQAVATNSVIRSALQVDDGKKSTQNYIAPLEN